MGNDEARPRFSARDQIPQSTVVLLHRTLPGADGLPLEPHHPEVQRQLALGFQLAGPLLLPTTRVLRDEHSDATDLAGEPDDVDQRVESQAGVFVALRVMRLVADTLAAVVRAESERGV